MLKSELTAERKVQLPSGTILIVYKKKPSNGLDVTTANDTKGDYQTARTTRLNKKDTSIPKHTQNQNQLNQMKKTGYDAKADLVNQPY